MSERKHQYSEMTEAEKESIFKICKKFVCLLEKTIRELILAIEENLDSLHEEIGGGKESLLLFLRFAVKAIYFSYNLKNINWRKK